MKKFAALLLILVATAPTVKAIENPRAGARAMALSGTFTALTDPWSAFYNQAGLAGLNSVSASVFYTSRFGLKELSQMAATVVVPTKSGVFGGSFSQFGTGSYKESKLGLAFSKQLSSKISAAIQADFFSVSLPENERPRATATFETGLLYQPNDRLNLGIHVFNPVGAGLKTFSGKISIPVTFSTGVAYRFSDILLSAFELEKSSGTGFRLKSGTEFKAAKNLDLRMGWSLWPFSYTAGFGCLFGKITTDFGFSYYGNLGFTPSISISYTIK